MGEQSLQIEKLLKDYKELTDFTDQTEKNNFKFVSWHMSKLQKRKHEGFEQECASFLQDAIDIHIRCFIEPKIKWRRLLGD